MILKYEYGSRTSRGSFTLEIVLDLPVIPFITRRRKIPCKMGIIIPVSRWLWHLGERVGVDTWWMVISTTESQLLVIEACPQGVCCLMAGGRSSSIPGPFSLCNIYKVMLLFNLIGAFLSDCYDSGNSARPFPWIIA